MHAAYKLNKGVLFIVVSLLMMASSLLIYQSKTSAIAGWTTLNDSHAGLTLICKKYVNSGFGPLWDVRVALLSNSPTSSVTYTSVRFNSSIYRPGVGSVGQLTAGPADNGQWKSGQAYASQIHNDYLIWDSAHYYRLNGFFLSSWPSGSTQFSSIANCQ